MNLELKDKIVMITGSTGGVGEALVKAFAAEGCKLAISSTKQEKLDKMVPGLGLDADHLLTFVVDVTDEAQVKDMVEKTISHYGSLDVQVNNAGYEGNMAPVSRQTYDDFMKVYNINIFGPMYGMKYAEPQMMAQKSGTIVNIASNGSFVGAANMAPYVSSKHAIAGLSKCVALELAPYGVRVNCICPGAIDTPMMRSIEKAALGDGVSTDDAKKAFGATYPDGRYATAEEVADTTVYLASGKSTHISGSCIRIDGGLDAMC
jgi:NAD(P)-dependent dehydrogenase (short-subunit alcohol dehydrogenase family)